MLLLKRHLVALVKAGKKRQTIRLWSRAFLRAGQISYTPGLGQMRILSVEELGSLGELTETDACEDGFNSLRELLEEIAKIYGPQGAAGKKLFRIRFQFPLLPETAVESVVTAAASEPLSHKRAVAMTRRQREAVRAYVLRRMETRGS